MIDEKLEQYFDSMKSLWNDKNFQILISELTEQMESIDSAERTTSAEDLFFRKGQINVIRTLQNLSDNIDMLETDYKREQEPHQDADGDVFL
jgi:hypothetical protein